jgi:putative transposase
MKFDFIAQQRGTWPVEALCRVLAVTRQGFYRHRANPESKRAAASKQVDGVVRRLFDTHNKRRRYGLPRIHAAVQHETRLRIGKRRIENSMVRQGLFAAKPRRFVVTTCADEGYAHPRNLLARDFAAARPNQRWVTDITYLSSKEGWVYLAAILDLHSRKVVGWSLGPSLDTALAMRALTMALGQRTSIEPLLHHSDRGCQYTSEAYFSTLEAHDIKVSMSRKGNCWDNAVVESFFATLKKELIYRQTWNTRHELEHAVFEYIEAYYNRIRLHSALGYRSPAQAEKDFLTTQQAA